MSVEQLLSIESGVLYNVVSMVTVRAVHEIIELNETRGWLKYRFLHVSAVLIQE